MGALAGGLGGGGGATVSPSSTSSAGPQAGTTGSVILDFGGINLGNQDIPLSASTTAATNQAPTIGNVPSIALGTNSLAAYLPYILLAGAVVALYVWSRHK